MTDVHIPDEPVNEAELPAWFLEKKPDEQAAAIREGLMCDEKMLHKLAKTDTAWQVACAAAEHITDPELLADIALHGEDAGARSLSASRLGGHDRLLYTLYQSAADEHVRLLAAKQLTPEGIRMCEEGWSKSVFYPRLDMLLQKLDPAQDMDLIEYIARKDPASLRGRAAARKLPPARVPGPEDEEPDNDCLYFLTRKLVREENDPALLMRAVFESTGPFLSRMAFSRLTGWRHYEPCDAYSHRNYACGRVKGVNAEQIRALCNRIVRAEHDESLPHDAMLIEAAKSILRNAVEDAGRETQTEGETR